MVPLRSTPHPACGALWSTPAAGSLGVEDKVKLGLRPQMAFGSDHSAFLCCDGRMSAPMQSWLHSRVPGRSVLWTLPVLFAACAPTLKKETAALETASVAPIELKVQQLEGEGSLQRGPRTEALVAGIAVGTGEPVQLAGHSSAQLNLGGDALLELGSGGRLIALTLPGHGRSGLRSGFRLEKGYLRIVVTEEDRISALPLEVSLGRWVAQLQAGEYFFDVDQDRSTVCSSAGHLSLLGAQEIAESHAEGACILLSDDQPVQQQRMTASGWTLLRDSQDLPLSLQQSKQEITAQQHAQRRHEVEQDRVARAPAQPATAHHDASRRPASETKPGLSPDDLHLSLPTVESRQEYVVSVPERAIRDLPMPDTATEGHLDIAKMPAVSQGDRIDTRPLSGTARSTPAAHSPPGATRVSTEHPDAVLDAPAERPLPGQWIINVSTHASLDQANARVAELESVGHQAVVRAEIVRGLNSYRVVIEGLRSDAQAQSVVAELQSRHGLRSAWAFRVR